MEWHPILAARERTPGVWVLVAPDGVEYGRIELRRVNGDQLRYRAEHDGQVIGWATTLKVACERVHREFVDAMGPRGKPLGRWGSEHADVTRSAR